MRISAFSVRALLFGLCCVKTVDAIKCGTTLTKECKAKSDKRYNKNLGVDLGAQSKAWRKLSGLYTGMLYSYDPITFERIFETDRVEDFTGTNMYKLSPSEVFLNLTVDATRAYRHMYTVQEGMFGSGGSGRPGRVIFCDSWSVATWEKDGIANNMKTVCSNSDDIETTAMLDGSKAYPVDEHGLSFIERFRPNDDESAPEVQVIYTFTCSTFGCQRVAFMHERFENGERTVYQIGDLTEIVDEAVFTELIMESYETNLITERDQVLQPMRSHCLNDGLIVDSMPEPFRCPSTVNFCKDYEDPQCFPNRYDEPNGKVKPGVIVAFVLASVIFVLGLVALIWMYFTKAQLRRAREFFALRMIETMDRTDKTILEFTPEDMLKQYKLLEEQTNGDVNKDNMYTFLSSGPRGYIDYWDFTAFWSVIDRKKTGTVDFLEFCSVMAHSNDELNKANEEVKGGEKYGMKLKDEQEPEEIHDDVGET